ncbi:MAG: geopeptide radical SAM maturase [Thermodesulfovibrionales bacterium]|nr:geopeptide radical SAM maturase [Thermodesulfovibrionales bacterium]
MILSKYCKIYPDTAGPGSVVLFSTKKASKIAIPESMLEDIREKILSEDERETLFELGFLVNSADEEKKEILGFMDELNASDKVFAAQLVMNLDCNLACGYCFEGSRKGKFYMARETADKFVEFVKNAIVHPHPDPLPSREREDIKDPQSYPSTGGRGLRGGGIEEIRVSFYGGEPLLSMDLILFVSNAIKSFAFEKGIKYTGRLVTNATLLTPQSVAKLRHAGIKAASITLDGPESVHDVSRPFRGGTGSFRTIMKNLKEAGDILDLELGGNFTKRNYHRFPELLDYLIAEGLTPEKVFSMQFYPVIQEAEGIVNHDFGDGCSSVNEPWIFEAELFLREEIMKRGYRTSRIIPSICFIELRNKIIVNYDGAMYKCSGLIGRKEFCAGDLQSGIKDYRLSHKLDNWKNEECLDCAYLPLCFGGCKYMKLLRDGNMNGVDCKKPYLDATLEAAVRQDIRYKAGT